MSATKLKNDGSMTDFLTLFVDASFHPESKAAGYGAWAKRDGWPKGLFMGGELTTCRSSSDAEMCAIARAVALLRRTKALDGVKAVLIQSDCLHALETIVAALRAGVSHHRDGAEVKRRAARPTAVEYAALDGLRDAAGEVRLIVRHVRGHKGGNTRETVNEICDKIARKNMAGARQRRDLRKVVDIAQADAAAAQGEPTDDATPSL